MLVLSSIRDGIHAGSVIEVRRRVLLMALSTRSGVGASDIIDVRRREMGLRGAIGSGDSNVKPGQVPLFVYYRVAVLFSKWYISNRAVGIV